MKISEVQAASLTRIALDSIQQPYG